jgi:CheY-like chemotaxis protein
MYRATLADITSVKNVDHTMITDKKHILVVDDETAFTRLLKLNLEQTNHYVVRVENTPTAALAAAENFQPDLILLDIIMPGMDGGELAQCFRASPKLRSVPVVFLTAAATKAEVASRGGRIGGLPFLAKPVDLPEVIDCIEKHLGKPAASK